LLEISDKNVFAWEEIAYARLMTGNYSAAIDWAKQVMRYYPYSKQANQCYTQAQANLSRWN